MIENTDLKTSAPIIYMQVTQSYSVTNIDEVISGVFRVQV